MKQNLDKSNCIQLFRNNSWVPELPMGVWSVITLHKREFNLLNMANPLDTNRFM